MIAALRSHLAPLRSLGLDLLTLALPTALLAGTASAGFLAALDWVTHTREQSLAWLFLLPLCGALTGWVYHRWGKDSDRGNNLIIDEIHQVGGGVPRRMAPLVLVGTLLTHLGGGSAGREGTAVQMGGSLAAFWGRLVRIAHPRHRTLLLCGVAAGFGAVFGTPLAGAVFALEVLIRGRVDLRPLPVVLVAAAAADWVCAAWGVGHTRYSVALPEGLAVAGWGPLLLKAALVGLLFGLAARLFCELTHGVGCLGRRWVPHPVLRPALGGLLVLALALTVPGAPGYLGIGVLPPPGGGASIVGAFAPGGATPWDWLGKTLFTALTVGSGFKGGEVTPLFFVGANLGSALAGPFGMPVDLWAALGFVAVFAAAAKTPLACTLMAVELFGAPVGLPAGLACGAALIASGVPGLYSAQRSAESAGA